MDCREGCVPVELRSGQGARAVMQETTRRREKLAEAIVEYQSAVGLEKDNAET
jgi:hypothetical protein